MNTNLAYEFSKMSLEEFYDFVNIRSELEHWELLYGIPFCLASPNFQHQTILGEIFSQFNRYFFGKKCKPVISPFDVVLFEDTDFPTVCQPDLLVYCDEKQNDGNRLHGAPGLALEVWSDANNAKYRVNRIRMFKDAGIQEIWEVFPDESIIKIRSVLFSELYITL